MSDDQDIAFLKRDLSDPERTQFDIQFSSRRKDPTIALILSLLFGMVGVDRFYLGQTGVGIAKLLTFGGLIIWALIDLFLIMGAARRRNKEIAQSVYQSLVMMRR